MSKSKRKTTPAPSADKPSRRIWLASYGGDRCDIGYMVTTQDHNRPIAFVPFDPEFEPGPCKNAYKRAVNIVNENIDPCQCHMCIDLQPYGKPDSSAPMPGWVYRLGLDEVDMVDGDYLKDSEQQFPEPPCRFRMERMKQISSAA